MLFTGTFEMKDNDEILHCHLMELINCGNRVFPMVKRLLPVTVTIPRDPIPISLYRLHVGEVLPLMYDNGNLNGRRGNMTSCFIVHTTKQKIGKDNHLFVHKPISVVLDLVL